MLYIQIRKWFQIFNFFSLVLSLLIFSNCDETNPNNSDNYRLTSKPGIPTKNVKVGTNYFNFGDLRNCILFVPSNYSNENASPLIVCLHGATGNARNWNEFFDLADSNGILMLAIDSKSYTWDFINDNYGTDVQFLDKALNYTFERCNIDPTHLALAGFSDGASYALSLGLLNGDLFSHIIAFSPGFVDHSNNYLGDPKIYITHGTNDNILPVSDSRDVIVPFLKELGYEVNYVEHSGNHEITTAIFNSSLDWFVK